MHMHDDRKIKTCYICQAEIKRIQRAGKRLDKLGIWNFSKKIKGEEYIIWSKKIS